MSERKSEELKPWYCLVNDDDGHSYIIRQDETSEFEAWLNAAPYWEGYEGKDFEECAINGTHTLRFREWSDK